MEISSTRTTTMHAVAAGAPTAASRGHLRLLRKGRPLMGAVEIAAEVKTKLDAVRDVLAREVTANGDVCLTCSFQAEDVLLTKLAIALDAAMPILFLDTGYHFAETYAYRDRMAKEWNLNLINLLPEKTVAEQEAEFGLLYESAPDRCCGLRKVEPLFKAVAGYRVAHGLGASRRGAARPWKRRAVLAAGRQAGAEDGAAGCVDHARRVVRVRGAGDSAAAALRARLLLIGCEPCTTLPSIRTIRAPGAGRAQGGMRHSYSRRRGEVDNAGKRGNGGIRDGIRYWIFNCAVHRAQGVGAGPSRCPSWCCFWAYPRRLR